jgi:hypothetical protein
MLVHILDYNFGLSPLLFILNQLALYFFINRSTHKLLTRCSGKPTVLGSFATNNSTGRQRDQTQTS